MPKKISQAKADAVAYHAVAAVCKREANRDILDAGGSYDVALKCNGKVEGVAVSFPINGLLTVGVDNPIGTSNGPKAADVLALAIAAIPKARRDRWFKDITKENTDRGYPIDDDVNELAKLAIGKLTKKAPRRGSVSMTERAA